MHVHQRFDGAIDLFGYSAEMWLKAAYLRLRGIGPTGPGILALAAVKHWMKSAAPLVPFTDYHEFPFFAECVVAPRAATNRALPTAVESELRGRVVNGLHPEWVVDMRYRRVALTPTDAWAALANAWRVRVNRFTLT